MNPERILQVESVTLAFGGTTVLDGVEFDVGAGEIDWAALFALSGTAGLRHYFVEHDRPGDALASIEASYRYLSGT